MPTITPQQQFIEHARGVAFYGLSGSGKGYAYDVLNALRSVRPNLRLTPVHPSATMLGGQQAVHSAGRMQPAADCALIVLKPQDARAALEDAAGAGVKTVWLVQNAASRENLARAQELGVAVVQGCPVLFCAGQGFPHNLHRAVARMFGKV